MKQKKEGQKQGGTSKLGRVKEIKHSSSVCIHYDSGKDWCEKFNAKASKIAEARKCATGAMLCSESGEGRKK